MKTTNNIKIKLKNHLVNFGFKFFDNYDDYHTWNEQNINILNIPTNIKKKYFYYLDKNLQDKNYRLPISFYDLIAINQKLTVITHSMKSDDILNSGVSVINELVDHRIILDIGCNSGHLTSFYAQIFKNSKVIGLDKSKKAILIANKFFKKNKYKNLKFFHNYKFLKDTNFDFICDTQCLFSLNQKDLLNLLDIFKLRLLSKGKIISISNIPEHISANQYIKLFKKKNFFIEDISPIFIKNIYGVQALTKIIFTKEYKKKKYNLLNYYTNLRKKISIVNLNNLF